MLHTGLLSGLDSNKEEEHCQYFPLCLHAASFVWEAKANLQELPSAGFSTDEYFLCRQSFSFAWWQCQQGSA